MRCERGGEKGGIRWSTNKKLSWMGARAKPYGISKVTGTGLLAPGQEPSEVARNLLLCIDGNKEPSGLKISAARHSLSCTPWPVVTRWL